MLIVQKYVLLAIITFGLSITLMKMNIVDSFWVIKLFCNDLATTDKEYTLKNAKEKISKDVHCVKYCSRLTPPQYSRPGLSMVENVYKFLPKVRHKILSKHLQFKALVAHWKKILTDYSLKSLQLPWHLPQQCFPYARFANPVRLTPAINIS